MVQELHVVKCFSCENFQTQIVKKTNKWDCKVCGIKQSIKKEIDSAERLVISVTFLNSTSGSSNSLQVRLVSVRRKTVNVGVYGRGSGKDCRLHTQKLNALRGSLNYNKADEGESDGAVIKQSTELSTHSRHTSPSSSIDNQPGFTKKSKWTEFIDAKKIGDHDDNVGAISIESEQKGLPNKPLFLDSCSKKKRKYEPKKTIFKSPQDCPSSYSGEFNDITYFTKTESNKRVYLKRFKTNENVNTDNVKNCCDINYSVEESVGFLTKSSKEIERLEKNLEVKSVGKWGKYLENVLNDESSPVSAGNCDGVVSEADDSASDNLISPCSYLPQKKQLTNIYDKHTKHNDFDSKCHSSLCLSPFKQAHCESESFNLKVKIPKDKVENEKACNLPVNIFEQDCDISDIDFELNF